MYKSYYTTLELPEDASESDIRQAYRALAKKYHPDVNKSEGAHEKFIKITEAYEILLNIKQLLKGQPGGVTAEEWRNKEYKRNEEYEKFKQEIREKAKKQARMRYEEFQRQNEANKQTGFNDFVLILKIISRILAIVICVVLFLIPIVLSITQEWLTIFTLLIFWPFSAIIAWNIYDKRINYFLPGEFYYNFKRIKMMFEEKIETGKKCFYTSQKGNSKPYKLELLKLKEIVMKTGEFRQPTVNYINDKKIIQIPRSKKAFIFHALNTVIKIASVLGCLIFLDFSSMLWRIIAGIALAAILSSIISFVLRIKSSTTYLYSYGFILRVILWMILIIFCSRFYLNPLNIRTTDYINLIIFSIVIFDCVIMQGIDIILRSYASKPLVRQYEEVEKQLHEGYKVYNDVPVFSFLYPLFKWFVG